jgi:hypothetical protein
LARHLYERSDLDAGAWLLAAAEFPYTSARTILSELAGQGLHREPVPQPAEARQQGLYSVSPVRGIWRVAHVVKVDEAGVHVLLYVNRYFTQPTEIDESRLVLPGDLTRLNSANDDDWLHDLLERLNCDDNWDTCTISYLPLLTRTFQALSPTLIGSSNDSPGDAWHYEQWRAGGSRYL